MACSGRKVPCAGRSCCQRRCATAVSARCASPPERRGVPGTAGHRRAPVRCESSLCALSICRCNPSRPKNSRWYSGSLCGAPGGVSSIAARLVALARRSWAMRPKLSMSACSSAVSSTVNGSATKLARRLGSNGLPRPGPHDFRGESWSAWRTARASYASDAPRHPTRDGWARVSGPTRSLTALASIPSSTLVVRVAARQAHPSFAAPLSSTQGTAV